MKFGVCFIPLENWTTIPRYMKLAENQGFEYGWLTDSHIIWNDVYQYLTLCAAQTPHLRLGPLVTNPVTRHPSVVASAIATLNLISGGRAVLGIGKGDSAVRTLGIQPAKLKPFKQSVDFIRRLSRGEEVNCEGALVQMQWAKGTIPLYIAAYGPKTLEFAGQIADGVVLQIGAPSVIKWCIQHIRAGAEKMGRDMRDIDIVAATACCISRGDIQAARNQVRWLPAMVSNHVVDLLSRYQRSELPDDLVTDMDLIKDYDYREHAHKDAEHARYVTDDVVDKFTIIGTPEECVQKITELQALGVTQVCLYLVSMDDAMIKSTIKTFGKEIIPLFGPKRKEGKSRTARRQ